MKIAIVVNSAWAAYNYRFNLALAINRAGHEVIFITPYDSEYSEKGRKKVECFFDEKIVIDTYIQSINNIATHEKII